MTATRRRRGRVLLTLVLAGLAFGQIFSAAFAEGAAPPTSSQQEDGRMLALLREKLPPPMQPLPPPSSDLKNLEGTWIANKLTLLRMRQDMAGNETPLTEKARAILERRAKATYVDSQSFANAGTWCLPPGQPWQLGLLYPFQILQSKNAVTFYFSEYHTVWNLLLNSSERSAAKDLAYMGNSIAHWESDTLVVETQGYKQGLWLDPDGTPISKNAHLTLRIRRLKEQPELEIVTTIDDPEMFTRPWSFVQTFAWRPDMEVFAEYDCEKQIAAPDYLKNSFLQVERDAP
jgi:hypothetical protein